MASFECDDDDLEELSSDLANGLALQHGLKRRSSDRDSIEGSPVMNPEKRIDSNARTPILVKGFRENMGTPLVLKLKIKRNMLNGGEDSTVPMVQSPEAKSEPSTDGDSFTCIEDKEVPGGERQVLIIDSSGGENQHNTGDHQENALRTTLLCGELGCLRRKKLEELVVWADRDSNYKAPLTDLLRCHEYSYLKYIQDKCDASQGVINKQKMPSFYAPENKLDSDTPLGPYSLTAARNFCGAAMFGVDCLLGSDYSIAAPSTAEGPVSAKHARISQISRSFVVGRPPGHHAGPQGAVAPTSFWKRPEMTSSGFCLLNTAAVAASYARYTYGRNFEGIGEGLRIAIVDIDVHHGNGTEAIVRNLQPHSEPLPLPSSWAPQFVESYKPWLDETDARDTFFGSIQLFSGESFYPGSGADGSERYDPATCTGINVVNVGLTPIGPGPCDRKGRAALSSKKRAEVCAGASSEMRTKVEQMLLPRLTEFSPDLLIISAGFDAHYDDMYHYLTEEDYHWLTTQLCDSTAQGGKVLSVLEGGYSLSSTPPKPSKAKAPVPKSERTLRGGVSAPASPQREAKGGDGSVDKVREGEPEEANLAEQKFGIQGGDGGLVKGVLAHVAALCNKEDWDA
jgi:acetoin utilization deacetylase AcuC-like enzyme